MFRFFNYFRIYLPIRFFIWAGALMLLYLVSFFVPFLFEVAELVAIALIALFFLDGILLFAKKRLIIIERILPASFSLGDNQNVTLILTNNSALPWAIEIVDEVPVELQIRNFSIKEILMPRKTIEIIYQLKPTSRGEYIFNNINVFVTSYLGFVMRRMVIASTQKIPVYPSLLQWKRFQLFSITRISHQEGIKKIRRIGHSYEFDQIKDYVRGDDIRSLNWKATGKRGALMVNQYADERSQPVYCIIDKSRIMHMPFNGLSLLDYAINSALVISGTAVHKSDKAGLITFSDKIGSVIKADRKPGQIKQIMQALYHQKERTTEADFELLYQAVSRVVKGRSLLFLFTNFESIYGLERTLPLLRKINKGHLLVVVFFENTVLHEEAYKKAETVKDIYINTLAQQFLQDKRTIAQILQNYGIQTILTTPENLSINTLNKYLELKARGLI